MGMGGNGSVESHSRTYLIHTISNRIWPLFIFQKVLQTFTLSALVADFMWYPSTKYCCNEKIYHTYCRNYINFSQKQFWETD